MGGAKNHGVILPDADLDQAVREIIGAAYGSAGERGMALPVVPPVGKATAEAVREKLLAEIGGLKVGVATDPDAQYGPMVTAAQRARVESYIELGVKEGAELVLDGRGFALQGHEQGFFIGPTLFDQVKPTMKSYQDEIFGPVLQIAVPVAYHSFGGWKRSAFGDANQHGMEGVRFYTKVKTVTARWPESKLEGDSSFIIPTMR